MSLPVVSLDGCALSALPDAPAHEACVAPSGHETSAMVPAAAHPGELPDVSLTGQRGVVLRLLALHWLSAAGRSAVKSATNPRGSWHARPESLADHDAYRRSRAWVPPGQDGMLLGPAGNIYHHTLGRLGLLTGYSWAWLWARPLRILIALAVAGGIYLGFAH